jgi:hypothetical protein
MERIAVAVMNQVTKSHFDKYEEADEFEVSSINQDEKEIVNG